MTLNDASPHDRPPRRWWRWLAVAAVGGLALIGGGFVFDRCLTQKAWTDACAETDRLDPGWRWDDLMAARPNPPDNRNIAIRIRAIRAAMSHRWPDWTAAAPLPDAEIAGQEDKTLGPSVDQRRVVAGQVLEHGIRDLPPNRQLAADQVAALTAILAAANPALSLLSGLESLEQGCIPGTPSRPLIESLMSPDATERRTVMELLRFRATSLAHNGESGAALLDCRRMLALSRSAQAAPKFITGVFDIAIRSVAVSTMERVLAQTEPSAAAIADVRRDLATALDRPLLLDMLRGERAYLEDCVRAVDYGLVSAEKAFDDPPPPTVTGIGRFDRLLHRFRGGGWTKRDSAEQLRLLTMLVESAKQPADAPTVRAADVAAFRAGLSSRVQKDTKSYGSLLIAERRSRTLLLAADTALAAEQFRRDHGRWPASLDELVAAKLLPAVPVDLFDGKPFRLRRLADGLVVYSVGPDLADDGGEIGLDLPIRAQSKDVGVRLWDPAHRRQSALPSGP